MIDHFRAWSGPGRERRSPEQTPLEALTPPPFLTSCEPRGSAPSRGPTAPSPSTAGATAARLVDRMCQVIRTLHYSRRTERAYVYWVKRFVTHHGHRDPAGMGEGEIRSYLSHLAVNGRVSASTQNQALCALVFLYGRVLGLDLESLDGIEWAKAPKRLPVVLTRGEVKSVLEAMNGAPQLVCRILYGSGLRLVECPAILVPAGPPGAPGTGPPTPRGGPRPRPGPRGAPLRAGPEIPKRRPGMGLAVRLPGVFLLHRPAHRPPAPAPPPRDRGAEGHGRCRPELWPDEARHSPHATALLRHAPARLRL